MAAGVVAAVLAVTAATAWPRGSGGAGGAAAPSSAAAPQVTTLWRTPTGQPVTAPPAVTADRVIVGGVDGVIRAYRRTDGTLDWSHNAGPGVAVSANVVDNTVYLTTAKGGLVAADAVTGKELWRRRTGGTFSAPPIAGRNRVYAGGHDAVLYAYELGGDHRRWRVWTGGPIRTPVAVAGDVAVVADSDGRLHGADEDGRLLWTRTVGKVTGGPVAAGDAACVPIDDGTVRCVRASDRAVLSRLALPGTRLSRVVGGDGVVFAAAADRTLSAWDVRNGAQRWRYRPATGTEPAAGHLTLRAGEVDVAYPDGRLAGLDAGTGAPRWEHTVGDRFEVAPGGDAAALFAVGRTGVLYALRTPGAIAGGTATPAATPSGTSRAPSPTTKPASVHPPPPRRHPKTPRAGTTTSPSPTPSSEGPWPTPTAVPTTPPPTFTVTPGV